MKDKRDFAIGDMVDVRFVIDDMDFHKAGEVVKSDLDQFGYAIKVHDPLSPSGFSIEYLPLNYKDYQK